MWNNIIIRIDGKDKFVHIESDDFNISYGRGYDGYGFQCNFQEDDEKHKIILKNLNIMSKAVVEISKTCNEDKAR